MKQKNSDISLIVVDAVSLSIEEYPDVALSNIQRLVDAEIATNVYEFCTGESKLNHNGRKIKGDYRRRGELSGLLSETVAGDIILAGGSLGNKHYGVFIALLEAIKSKGYASGIHIPFDCTYSFEKKSDSGDSWAEGKLGNPEMPVFDRYREEVKKYNGCIVELGEKCIVGSQIITLYLWDEWKQMADYLRKNETH